MFSVSNLKHMVTTYLAGPAGLEYSMEKFQISMLNFLYFNLKFSLMLASMPPFSFIFSQCLGECIFLILFFSPKRLVNNFNIWNWHFCNHFLFWFPFQMIVFLYG